MKLSDQRLSDISHRFARPNDLIRLLSPEGQLVCCMPHKLCWQQTGSKPRHSHSEDEKGWCAEFSAREWCAEGATV